jgi:hypothetical protein
LASRRAAIADIGSLRFGFLGASLVLDANEPNTCSFERAGLASEFSIKPWRSLPRGGSGILNRALSGNSA